MRVVPMLAALVVVFTGPRAVALPPEVARLKVHIHRLEEELAALQAEFGKLAELGARIDALQHKLDALGAGSSGDEVDRDRLADLEAALEEIRADIVTSSDLRRYQLKPNEKEYKSRSTQEIELRVAMSAFRQAEIERRLDAVDGLVLDEDLRPTVESFGQVAALFLANDQDVRARATFRFYWEANRFLEDGDLLFVYAMPEIMVFAQRHDIDRYQLDRDFTEPRDRVALRLKKAALGAQLGDLRVVGGVLQLTHGAGFFINPTNPFTPKHVLDPRREVDGVPAAQLEWTLVATQGLTLSAQVTGVTTPVRNDVEGLDGDRWHEVAWGGLSQLKLDTDAFSLAAIAILQSPDAIGRAAPAFGGTFSFAPLGITTSVEGLVREDIRGVYRPELVASLQGFFADVGANGTTWVAEYYYNGHGDRSEDAIIDELVWAIEEGETLYASELLLRPLSRSHYLNLYLEPSLSTEVQASVAALVGLEEGGGVLARFGLDWEISAFVLRAFGGFTWGAPGSELDRHVLESFFELAVSASF